MPSRDWELRIEDIFEAINEIAQFTKGMTFEAFCADPKTIKACLYNIAVIGEAARHIPAEIATKYQDNPATRDSLRKERHSISSSLHVYDPTGKFSPRKGYRQTL